MSNTRSMRGLCGVRGRGAIGARSAGTARYVLYGSTSSVESEGSAIGIGVRSLAGQGVRRAATVSRNGTRGQDHTFYSMTARQL
jgi:hypothetical protein